VLAEGISDIQVTISHCATHATATAIAVCDGAEFPKERQFIRPEDF